MSTSAPRTTCPTTTTSCEWSMRRPPSFTPTSFSKTSTMRWSCRGRVLVTRNAEEEPMSEDVPPNERVNIVIQLNGPKKGEDYRALLAKIRKAVESEGLTVREHSREKQ